MAMDDNPPQPTARSLKAPPGVALQSWPDVQQAGKHIETLRATVRRIGARQLAVGARRDGVRDQRAVWLAGGAPTTSDINADADAQPKPDLAAAHRPAQFFAVSEGLTSECAIEGAAMFLGAVDSACSNLPAICRLSRRRQKARPREPGSLLDSVVGRV